MSQYRVWHTATLVIPDGSDTNSAGEGCEPGHGYREEHGWVDPSWSLWEVYDKREAVLPDLYDPTDCKPECRDPDCVGCLTPPEWLATMLNKLPGGPEDWDGSHPTWYAADADTDHKTGISALRAMHAEGFSDKALRAAWYALQAMYAKQEAAAREFLERAQNA